MGLSDFFAKIFGPGKGYTFDELSRRLDIPPDHMRSLEVQYSQFSIPKKAGGKRTILAPSSDLKKVQRTILHKLLAHLKAHPCATGFERGHSIVTNALPHVGKSVVLRMDLKDFFISTSARRVQRYFRRIGWNRQAAAWLAKVCTWDGGLPQGAPTSPRLSNLLNCQLDARLYGLAVKCGASYSRYADDLTFSYADSKAPGFVARNPKTGESVLDLRVRTASVLIRMTKLILKEYGYRIHHKKKLSIRRPHQQQRVTGLVVNAKANLPRETRRWLRAVEHRIANGRSATLTPEQLAGWRALQSMVATQSQRP